MNHTCRARQAPGKGMITVEIYDSAKISNPDSRGDLDRGHSCEGICYSELARRLAVVRNGPPSMHTLCGQRDGYQATRKHSRLCHSRVRNYR